MSISCSVGEVLDRTLGVCSVPGQKGRPDEPWLCSNPSSVVGNPINITTGNKFEERVVLKLGIVDPIVVSRYYNSFDGMWVHGYSAHLVFGEGVVVLVGSDGKQSMYTAFNDKYVSATNIGTLDYDGLQWVYVDSSNKKCISRSLVVFRKQLKVTERSKCYPMSLWGRIERLQCAIGVA
ncbi:DUF6531 domain-containing protein [Pseudomonas alliivorans]|nr:DUF6531 domain-containing protein [Pseudomonas alliivorans]